MLCMKTQYRLAVHLRALARKDIGGRGAKNSRESRINESQWKLFAAEMRKEHDRQHKEGRKRREQLAAITREQWTDLLENNCIANGPSAELLCRISNCTFPDKMLIFRHYTLGETFAKIGATTPCQSKPRRLGISQERVRQLTAKAWRLIFKDESVESKVANIPRPRKKVFCRYKRRVCMRVACTMPSPC